MNCPQTEHRKKHKTTKHKQSDFSEKQNAHTERRHGLVAFMSRPGNRSSLSFDAWRLRGM